MLSFIVDASACSGKPKRNRIPTEMSGELQRKIQLLLLMEQNKCPYKQLHVSNRLESKSLWLSFRCRDLQPSSGISVDERKEKLY